MAQEKEVKLLLKINLDKFEDLIKEKGFVSDGEKVETLDIYLDAEDWRLYESIAALRIRIKKGKLHSLSFKKFFHVKNRTANPWHIEEIETKFPLENAGEIEKIFEILKIDHEKIDKNKLKDLTITELIELFKNSSFPRQIKISKTRQIYSKNSTEICIDEIESLGTLVEIESENEDPLTILNTILSPADWERNIEGVSNMFVRVNFGLDDHLTYMKKFDTDPAWNVWENEKEWYEGLN